MLAAILVVALVALFVLVVKNIVNAIVDERDFPVHPETSVSWFGEIRGADGWRMKACA